MYQDKIKKQLIDKIYQLKTVDSKIGNSKICETCYDAEKCGLCDKGADLIEEIKQLQLDTIYFPLIGLDEEIIKELEERWRDMESIGSGEVRPEKDENKKDATTKDNEPITLSQCTKEEFEELGRKNFVSNIEKHLDFKLVELKEGIKERIAKLKPLRMAEHISLYIRHIYSEVIRCYLFGNFEASCVLCRAIVESMLKEFIEHNGQGHLLIGKDKQSKKMSVQEICLNVLDMKKEIISLYNKIGNKADNILHKKDVAKDAEATKAIELLQEFIKKFPRQV